MTEKPTLYIVGAGPAGLNAAIAAARDKSVQVIIIDRETQPGGILNQCIHVGFGLKQFKEELTGPEYAHRVFDQARGYENIEILTDTNVVHIDRERHITYVSPDLGLQKVKADAIILGTGCRERARGVIHIPGERPAGILCAGLAQKFVNIDGYLPGENVVILGSGDIGLIMARRLTLQGAKVLAVIELADFLGGLSRNVVQCLNDFDIPLYLSHTVTDIIGQKRVEAVKIAKVGPDKKPLLETEFEIKCDTLLLSVGLIPENELAEQAGVALDPLTNGCIVNQNYMTNVPGIFACGNALQVHDLVDDLASEAQKVGQSAISYLQNQNSPAQPIIVTHDEQFRYVLPHKIDGREDVTFFFRVSRPLMASTLSVGDFQKKFKFLQPNTLGKVTVPQQFLENINEVRLCLHSD